VPNVIKKSLEVGNGKPEKGGGQGSVVKVINRQEETVSSGVIPQFISGQISQLLPWAQ